MRRPPVVLFYVQHLRGVGHVFRATRITRELAAAGARVHLVWGGTRIPAMDLTGLDVTWLDPVKVADDSYALLVRPDGSPADEALKARRAATLMALFERTRPDIVVTEAYPFGRRQMRFELEPLMRAARAAPWRPLTASSIRDIMQENRADKRVRESLDAAKAWFDLVLVHGDPRLMPIEASLQGAAEIADKVRYTGLVAPPPPDLAVPPSVGASVVVSAGGGAFGERLTDTALEAMPLCRSFPSGWLVVAGPERDEDQFGELARRAPAGMTVRRFVPDLARVFAAAAVCVTMAGYNTVGDLMRARARAVLVPFTGGRETEQLRRAEALAARGLASLLIDRDLSPPALAAAVDSAAAGAAMDAPFDLDGAAAAARILVEEWAARVRLESF